MRKFEELNATNSTIVEWNGKELRTINDPYIVTLAVNRQDVYTASAIDNEGNRATIYWTITNPEATDESEAADWENPIEVFLHKW